MIIIGKKAEETQFRKRKIGVIRVRACVRAVLEAKKTHLLRVAPRLQAAGRAGQAVGRAPGAAGNRA